MIEYIRGKVIDKDERGVVVDVAGVGYRVFLNAKSLSKVIAGEQTEINTYMAVKEDSQELYGFMEKNELEFFKMLISVSGIGPKTALNFLTISSVSEIKKAIASEDPAMLTVVPGIGKKTAERVIVELKEKVEMIGFTKRGKKEKASHADAIQALVQLGYGQSDARRVLMDIDDKIPLENKIKEALKRLNNY